MSFWNNLRRAVVTMYHANGLGISKGAAYSAMLSLFPVLTTLAAMLVQVRARPVLDVLSSLLSEAVPPGTEDLVLNRLATSGRRPLGLLIAAGLLSLWAASGLMLSLMEGFDAVYKVGTKRSLVEKRLVAALLVFATALPAVGASAMILFGTRSEQSLLGWLGRDAVTPLTGWVLLGGRLARYAVALAGVVASTSLLYYVAPNRPQSFRKLLPGAVVATGLWLAATSVFAWYVRNIANYNVMYGSIGAAIALLAWMYVLAVIAIVGCAFNAVREDR